MLNTKDATGYLRAFDGQVRGLFAVAIPGESNTLSAEQTAAHATRAGLKAEIAATPRDAVQAIVAETPQARILICGSLYLAGSILRTHS